ncbi:hypothetical protein, partial [Corynebacterium striatum]|uniref:hypothetical protein n=1 Tax=Corynebacterium striatum TaxID=43770 RepID=UPI003B5D0618
HRHIFRQDAVLYKTDHTILRILVKFSWHIPDFPIYSNGTKPGALHSTRGNVKILWNHQLTQVGLKTVRISRQSTKFSTFLSSSNSRYPFSTGMVEALTSATLTKAA